MTPPEALAYSFLFGLFHGILPDEHTWPITFSYAVASASGKEGMKTGLYFSAAFTIQRMLISELAYLALAPKGGRRQNTTQDSMTQAEYIFLPCLTSLYRNLYVGGWTRDFHIRLYDLCT
jgi:hypothetical protein